MTKYIYIIVLLAMAHTLSGQYCVGDSAKITWKYWDDYYVSNFAEMEINENYPNQPYQTKTIYRLQTPTNYNDYFGSLMEGYIRVPQTTTVTFNITANAYGEFYLSTDDQVDNQVLLAYNLSATSQEEHDQDTTQTSVPVTLQGNTYYYFKFRQVEGTSGDYAAVWWKTDLVDPNEWNIITAAYLWDLGCLPTICPERGTPCDDNDATTTDDQEDGLCNCMGTPPAPNSCIGERSKIVSYRYDTITGSSLNDLYEAPNYPTMPTTAVNVDFIGIEQGNNYDEIGSLMQGYLTVPVTGNYKFNVTGDDNTILYISSDEDPANKQDNFCLVSGHTSFNEFDKYVWQSTGNVYLEKNNYYYFEVNHKEGGGNEFYAVQWQTPFTTPGIWKRTPLFYLYDYDCELACVQQGTPCDDGDIFTNNDMFDANCDCVGTPCSGPDCDNPLASYVPYEPCNVTELIDNNPENNWLSCTKDENPNPLRDSSHWIMYDFGQPYEIYTSHVWNYNVEGSEDLGFENVAIDISDDGVNWTEFGTYTWPLSMGESPYSGFAGPNFNAIQAQYILVTSLDMDMACRGIGKMTFAAVSCPSAGTVCDDQDPNTILDHIDNNCECRGVPLDANLCTEEYLILGDSLLSTNNFSAENYVSSISQIETGKQVSMIGGQYVELNPGFETEESTLFLAAIAECLEIPLESNQAALKAAIREKQKIQREKDQIAGLQVIPMKNGDYLIKFYLDKAKHVNLSLYDHTNQLLSEIIDTDYRAQGVYSKRIRTKKLPEEIIQVRLVTEDNTETKSMTILPPLEE